MHMFFKAANKSINAAIEQINNITDNAQFDCVKVELFQTVVTAIHLIADCEERVRKKLSCDDSEFLKAFLYINNQLKHDINLELFYYDVSGSMFPFSFPMRFGTPGIYWRDFVDNGEKKARGKRKHYEQYLMDKDIEITLRTAKEILDKYSN